MKIHLIENIGRFTRISEEEELWESGFWPVTTAVAEELVGGHIYLHSARAKPSKFGGVIQSFRVESEGEFEGKVVFTFLADMEHKNVFTGKEGWGMGKKIDRSEDA